MQDCESSLHTGVHVEMDVKPPNFRELDWNCCGNCDHIRNRGYCGDDEYKCEKYDIHVNEQWSLCDDYQGIDYNGQGENI